ncbi:hypothetical protein QYF36_017834 [Acer negundo]|nr:hypothetical protein QYF36_017834 [Acer negundo]
MRKKGTENRAYSDLREAAAKGDWGKAEGIFKGNPQYVRHSLTYAGETALQAAVLAGHSDFVKNLLSSSYMRKEDLERENGAGNTAFILAAKLGNIEFVLMMLEKNEDLVKFRDKNERLPVQVAASLGHKDIVKCLYNPTKAHFNNDEDRIRLLLTLIDNDIYDVALWMVEEFPSLAFCRTQKTDGNVETALHVLARKPLKTLNEFGILKRFYYRSFLKFSAVISSIRVEKKKMDQEARAALQMQQELRWFKEVEKFMPPSIAGAKNKKVFCTTLIIVFDGSTIVPALLAIAIASILVIIFISPKSVLLMFS